ncbi:amidohydrolase 3 [Leucosporidium creatinivorum]|uniref:Amidohydrolase 3 n=1 Tax=Leucosporidium creatinivorum TaxID=106004 RepID=A0A1Y2FDA0_9BASI|nr:amidohydrolase 3 [Leucosporidium creatinivorum]
MATLITGAKIFTADPAHDELYSTLLVDQTGRVRFVGEESEAQAALASLSPTDITRIDMGGKVIIPGLIDAHSHLSMMGGALLKPDLVRCKSLAEIKETLLAHHGQDPSRPRLLGRAWLFNSLVDDAGVLQRPHKRILDELLPDLPIYLDAVDLHSIWVSSAALEEMGITKETPDPKGGRWEKDEQGELTGLVMETPVVETVWPFLAQQLSEKERDQAFDTMFAAYLATGVTGAIDMAMEGPDLEALERAFARYGGSLPLRVAAHWIVSPTGTEQDRLSHVTAAIKHRERLASRAPFLRIAGIKVIVDGVIDSCTAFMKEPYSDGSRADPIWTLEELLPVVLAADKAGLQIALHAIGDGACTVALDALERAFKINGTRHDRRHRLEHMEAISEDDIKRLASLQITASLQPVHADPLIAPNWHAMLGDDRCTRAFPWKEFRDHNVAIALGTDAPTAPYEAMPNLYVATTRRSALEPDMPWPPSLPQLAKFDSFCFSLKGALLGATRGAAHSCHSDHEVGSLAPGMSADFAVLSIDPFAEGVEVLARAQEAVVETWVAGKKVYSRA